MPCCLACSGEVIPRSSLRNWASSCAWSTPCFDSGGSRGMPVGGVHSCVSQERLGRGERWFLGCGESSAGD